MNNVGFTGFFIVLFILICVFGWHVVESRNKAAKLIAQMEEQVDKTYLFDIKCPELKEKSQLVGKGAIVGGGRIYQITNEYKQKYYFPVDRCIIVETIMGTEN